MKQKDLEAVVAYHGLSIDGWRCGAGKFRDLEIGVGAPHSRLVAFVADMNAKEGDAKATTLTRCSNVEHADYGREYAQVASFWWEDTIADQ